MIQACWTKQPLADALRGKCCYLNTDTYGWLNAQNSQIIE